MAVDLDHGPASVEGAPAIHPPQFKEQDRPEIDGDLLIMRKMIAMDHDLKCNAGLNPVGLTRDERPTPLLIFSARTTKLAPCKST